MDETGNTEEINPSPEILKEILDEMNENDECFISLIRIHQKNLKSP